jgi:long-chain acyl-CoA synthetase
MTQSTALPANWPVVSLAQAHAALTAPGVKFETETLNIRGVETRCWKNAPRTLVEIWLAGQSYPDRDFLVYENERATYAAFGKATLALAHDLMANGVKKGDRVALIMRNLPEFPVAFYATALIGAIIVPLNAWWTGAELEYGLVDSGSKVAIMDSERWERLAGHLDHLPDLQRIYVSRQDDEPTDPRVRRLEDVINPVNDWAKLPTLPMPPAPIDPEDDATIFYTSGTTGKPKGALGTHRNIATNILTTGLSVARMFVMAGEPLPDPDPHNTPQRSILLVVPLFHVTGFHASLNPAIATGAKVVLMRKWDVEVAMQLIEKERINGTGGVPTIAWQLIEHPAREKYDLSSLDTVSYGGAPSAPELVRQISGTFKGCHPGNGWGMTETSATFTGHLGWEYVNRPTSCGPAAPTGEMEVRDTDGVTVLPVGAVGELWCKGPQVVKGYWNQPEATAQTFQNGWLRTGDLARLDEEGYCFMIDRAKDMLIRGGENIYCIEVENALYDHPAIMDAALVGIPHRTLGEEPAAVVTLKPDHTATEQELRAFVADRLAAFKVPVKILFQTETLPRNANGKIMKSELKKLFEAEKAGA